MVLGMTQNVFATAPENKTSDLQEFSLILVESCRILVYELSCFQKIVPLFFSNQLKNYLEIAGMGLLQNWESDVILKSFCFMFLKVLKTYVYYQGGSFSNTEPRDSSVSFLIRKNQALLDRQKVCNFIFNQMISDYDSVMRVIGQIFQHIMIRVEGSYSGGSHQKRRITRLTSTTRNSVKSTLLFPNSTFR